MRVFIPQSGRSSSSFQVCGKKTFTASGWLGQKHEREAHYTAWRRRLLCSMAPPPLLLPTPRHLVAPVASYVLDECCGDCFCCSDEKQRELEKSMSKQRLVTTTLVVASQVTATCAAAFWRATVAHAACGALVQCHPLRQPVANAWRFSWDKARLYG